MYLCRIINRNRIKSECRILLQNTALLILYYPIFIKSNGHKQNPFGEVGPDC